MLGNWAMGSPDMATPPRMTMNIEITMATIGRLMKNFDMTGYLFSAGAGATGFASVLAAAPWAGAAAFAAAALAAASGSNGCGLTTMSGLTFWVPSTTTFSPGFNPSEMIQSEPILSATFTGRIATLLSAPTTATRYFPCISVTDRWGISNAPFLTDMIARTRP